MALAPTSIEPSTTPPQTQSATPAGRRSGGVGFPTLALPATIWVLIAFAIPAVVMLGSSFLTYDGATVVGDPTLANYTGQLGNGFFRSVLWWTIWMSVAVAAICVVLGLLVAHYLVRSSSRLKGLALFIVISPLVSSVVVRTYGWLVLLERDGLINTTLGQAGIIGAPIEFMGSKFAVIVGLVHVLLPFAVFTVMSSLQGVDTSLERASRDLGAGPVTTFRKVTLPLIAPGLVSGFILTFAISFGAYATPAILGSNRLQTLATLVQERMVSSLEWGQAAAIAVLILGVGCGVVVVALLLSARRSQTRS